MLWVRLCLIKCMKGLQKKLKMMFKSVNNVMSPVCLSLSKVKREEGKRKINEI